MNAHPVPAVGQSQCNTILTALQDAAGEWVEMPKLAKLSKGYAVHSRISDLRRRGHVIEHKNTMGKRPDGSRKVRSYYRLTLAS